MCLASCAIKIYNLYFYVNYTVYVSIFSCRKKFLEEIASCFMVCFMIEKVWSGHLWLGIFVASKLLSSYLLTNTIGKRKGDYLWQVEMCYVCSDPSSNENKMVPDLGMVQKLKLLIWSCQKGTGQNWEGFFCIFHLESINSKNKVIGSPKYQISLPLCHMTSFPYP